MADTAALCAAARSLLGYTVGPQMHAVPISMDTAMAEVVEEVTKAERPKRTSRGDLIVDVFSGLQEANGRCGRVENGKLKLPFFLFFHASFL